MKLPSPSEIAWRVEAAVSRLDVLPDTLEGDSEAGLGARRAYEALLALLKDEPLINREDLRDQILRALASEE